ncbi:MAG: hypothetical protein HY360_11015 [Verrucomicrobia bacterium]|nr:hypothetical protein [Verrucomicrobiota bacterium]
MSCTDKQPVSTRYPPLRGPSLDQVYARIESWRKQFPKLVRVKAYGKSLQGRPLLAIRITDPEADDQHKEVALMTALHSGLEQSGTVGMLYLMKWLLASDPKARDILRKQILVFMPVPNPDGYVPDAVKDPFFNAAGKEQYSGWSPAGPPDPPNNPEGVAVQQVMEEYQPEVHADWHGLLYTHADFAMIESSGFAFSNLALRPYHRRITCLMDEAALQEGFPCDLGEEDSEELFWGPELEPIANKLWRGRPRFFAATYAYHRFHTLTLASEVSWARNGFIRHRRLLEIGNEIWPGEFYPGYPTRVMMRNVMDLLVAYGDTAENRRRSRAELWNYRSQMTHASNNPVAPGRALHVTATNPAAAQYWLPVKSEGPPPKGVRRSAHFNPGMGSAGGALDQLLEKAGRDSRFNVQALREFAADLPPHNRVQAPNDLAVMRGSGDGAPAPIQHGLSMRLRLPFRNAKITELRLNGHPLGESAMDGYVCYRARGYTYVQVNYPPSRTKTEDIFIVTCSYDPMETRPVLFSEIFAE